MPYGIHLFSNVLDMEHVASDLRAKARRPLDDVQVRNQKDARHAGKDVGQDGGVPEDVRDKFNRIAGGVLPHVF